ncbi:4-(cytidine 5'-diphospho)-2-C-methyl-D-erythritol kinase [Selenomonas sp. TAMA-11512]|uniref:4-(cytidine 5'-diphospho)-2-C-methyl-D-erythritol kinase n=1 Tax=Selenomonas sp. TAMA-11512 TaxID=3095337 RepID=UPI00308D226F|nr:4-(cytidine 5'-diphospho)-2-C-methyl-D-erythritol kinase [Selenomonas sp. TAMA-11512]
MHTLRSVTLDAPAKINLTLDVLGIRPDGYHEVTMVMQTVSLVDTVRLEKRASGISLSIDGNVALEADETNLAYRAAKHFFQTQKVTGGVHIHLMKRIPMAAGLAGGSTDAAAVIKGLSILYQPTPCRQDLLDMCASIGSDVPFCYEGGTMLATGRGEILERLPDAPAFFVVLAKPKAAVSTAWVYKRADAFGALPHPATETMLEAIRSQDVESIKKHLKNVLEVVTIEEYPEIRRLKDFMEMHGAAALMSGSGPTVFGLLEGRAEAEVLLTKLRHEFPGTESFLSWTIPKAPPAETQSSTAKIEERG